MYVVSRASFGAIPPVTLGLLRLLLGGAALWLVLRLSGPREPLPREERWRLPLLGLCIAATITTQFIGTDLASAHDGALLTTITPLFIVPLAWLLLGERPRWRVVAGTLLALAGVVIIVGSEQGSGLSAQARSLLIGDGLLIISAFFWALFTVLGTPLARKHSALVVTTYGTLWSLVFFCSPGPLGAGSAPCSFSLPHLAGERALPGTGRDSPRLVSLVPRRGAAARRGGCNFLLRATTGRRLAERTLAAGRPGTRLLARGPGAGIGDHTGFALSEEAWEPPRARGLCPLTTARKGGAPAMVTSRKLLLNVRQLRDISPYIEIKSRQN
ncbi:hypothetical protein A4R35_21255 [Thermogemmatispora tikiterensis]|uniref:EamA domain-containing protein n=1 Tax=Thermogemmatispora tikiterensis TaxID=1825093 RepID=A0A328VPG7_9CHLR|nr:hypothetical protein A4R35_21255 [Thermogemmatispora tikiterensis]